jgi:hypothetical protein
MATIFGWIARHALLFVLLLAGMVAYSQFSRSSQSSTRLEASINRIDGAETELRGDLEALRGRAVTGLQDQSLAAIDARLVAARTELAVLQRAKPRGADLLRAPQAAIVTGARHEIASGVLEQEIAFLGALRANVADRGKALGLDGQIADSEARIAALDAAWRADAANIAALPSRLDPRRFVREGLSVRDLADVYAERQAANRRDHAAVVAKRRTLVEARQRLGEIRALATPAVAVDRLETLLAPLQVAAAAQGQALEASLEREARRWWERLGIDALLRPAALALALIILMPFAVRTLFYWVLAPLASLQKPITLLEAAAPIPLPSEKSSVSKAITVANGEELLIKQGFLQTSSQQGAKATQWLLDASYPVTSLAAGLWFLTRISGGGGTTTVSAVRDPFAEITRLVLPKGAACVLQPRAIAGVVQPVAAPLRITSHWRLGTLNAWLTWQLRFLVFHGPADILLTGGRGVRVEPAEVGRNIGQDQLIGFSAGLSYSTGRAETFLPYLLGQESLLKDRIAAGSGILIAEEAPRAGQARSGIKRGLEGAVDAVLKVFGI